jgi:biopolymer transport protein ExbB/TolQ
MKKQISSEFIFQLTALLLAIIVVHGAYVGFIRPAADAQLREQAAQIAAGAEEVPERSLAVVIRDFEQEACFILLIWALAIMGYKGRQNLQERRLLDASLIDAAEGTSVLPADAREYSRTIESLPEEQQDFLLPRTLLAALQRFATTGSIQAVSETVREQVEVESDRLDSELSMVRYIAWAIPSIGFIGTVRGIGDALGQAYEAVEGDISGVTASLGVAFNSTFVALVLSIIIMFCLHQLQLAQERLVLDAQRYVDKRLMRHLVAPD